MKRNMWRVVAGLLLIALGVVLTLAQLNLLDLSGEWVGPVVMLVGAAVFLSIWSGNRKEWWPLIPGLVLAAWSAAGILDLLGVGEPVTGLVGIWGTALPFLLIFLQNRKSNWWALIPGGIVLLVGTAGVLGSVLGEEWVDVLVLVGIALAFLGVFVANRRSKWALIPAGVLGLVAIGSVPVQGVAQLLGAGLLILAGLALILFSVLRRS